MRRAVMIALSLTAITGTIAFADDASNPTYAGATGAIAYPTAFTPGKGAINVALKYTTENPGVITPSIAIGLFRYFEISAGWDIQSDHDNPVMFGTKYIFYRGKSMNVALGVNAEIATSSAYDNYFTPYIVMGEYLKSFRFSVGFGYTFGPWIYHWNIFVGAIKSILPGRLWLLVDFANYPYRHAPSPSYAHEYRGVANVGLRVKLTSFLQFNVAVMDVFDNNREIEAGLTLRLKV